MPHHCLVNNDVTFAQGINSKKNEKTPNCIYSGAQTTEQGSNYTTTRRRNRVTLLRKPIATYQIERYENYCD